MANYDSNYEIAQEISARLGNEPIPFDSVYSICLQIYQELGGDEQDFDSVYSILLEILPLVEGGGAGGRYTAGDGINISEENVISANSGAVLNGDISLSNGAPVNALGIWPNNIIPQGTSIQSVLEKLLNRELFPNAATKPTFTVSGGSSINEIGVVMGITAPTATTNNGKFNASYNSPAQPSVVGVTWSNESTTSEVLNGFTVHSGNNYTVDLGTNKLRFTYTKDYSAPSNMPVSNQGHSTQSTSKISTDGSDISAIWAAGSVTKTADITVTGVYACFSNISGSTLTDNAATKAGLTSGNELIYNDTPSEVTNSKHFKFAFPADRNVSFKIKDLQGNFVDYSGTYEVNTVSNFYNGIDYKVLVTTGGFVGSNTYKFILSKNLNA